MMKIRCAALAAALLLPAGVPVRLTECYSPAAIEAEQGMRFFIDVMVASTACRDQSYGLFQQRNQATVLSYQKAMIAHFHGNADMIAGIPRWPTTRR